MVIFNSCHLLCLFVLAPKAPVASSLALAGARPAWRQKDQPHVQKQFVFEKPSEVKITRKQQNLVCY